MNQDRIC